MTATTTPARTTGRPIPVNADWTTCERSRITGILMFVLPPAQDTALTSQGKEPQFLITGSTRTTKVTAVNDYGDEPFQVSGTLDHVTDAAAQWLGITTPLDLTVHREYQTR